MLRRVATRVSVWSRGEVWVGTRETQTGRAADGVWVSFSSRWVTCKSSLYSLCRALRRACARRRVHAGVRHSNTRLPGTQKTHPRYQRTDNESIHRARCLTSHTSQNLQAAGARCKRKRQTGSTRFGRGMGGHHTAGRGCCWMDGAVARRGPVAPPPVAPRRAGALAPKAMPPGRRPKPMHHGQSRLMANHQRTPSAVCERQIRSRLVVPVAAQGRTKSACNGFSLR